MPIILVDESILDTYHEIVVCPYKDAKVFCYEDIDKLIYEKANNKQLEKDFERLYDCRIGTIYATKGYDVAKRILHVVAPDWIYDPDFEIHMFKTYDNLIRVIKKMQFKEVVLPVIRFSYKRF